MDWLFSSAEQGTHSAGQQSAGNSGNSANPGGDPNDFNRFTQTASDAFAQARTIGSKAVETTTGINKIESQLNQKNSLLGIETSGNMSSLNNPQVQKGLQVINSITSNPTKIWEGTWKGTPVYEYIDTSRGVGVILNRATGALETILQRTNLEKLESYVQNGTARWLK